MRERRRRPCCGVEPTWCIYTLRVKERNCERADEGMTERGERVGAVTRSVPERRAPQREREERRWIKKGNRER